MRMAGYPALLAKQTASGVMSPELSLSELFGVIRSTLFVVFGL